MPALAVHPVRWKFSRRASSRPGLPALILSVVLAVTLATLLWINRVPVSRALSASWQPLLFWGIVILIVNLIHFEMDPLQFTLDMPLLLATAILYPPAVAAAVAFLGSADAREFLRSVTLSRAVFNRSQIALSVFAAGVAYHSMSGPNAAWPTAILGTALSMGVFYAGNTVLVGLYVAISGRGTPVQVIRRLILGKPVPYALTYFGYGLLALVIVRLFQDVGAWAVVLFLIPIIVAHFALVRAENLRLVAGRLQTRERLLELLSDRILDERRDERTRIAAGLHDDVLQSLIRMSQLGFFLRKEVPQRTQARQDADELVRLSAETVEILREVLGDLRKSPVGHGGLVRTLRGLAEDLRIQWRIPISVSGPLEIGLPSETQMIAYYAAKEGTLNALKHADPTSVGVTIESSPDELRVQVVDDGRGFDPERVDHSTHFGLGLLRERVQLAGGSLEIYSVKGEGTRLVASVPGSRQE